MTIPERSHILWRKSAASGFNDCVEVAFVGAEVLMRHSQHPSGTVLSFSQSEWEAFLVGVRSGEFDDSHDQ